MKLKSFGCSFIYGSDLPDEIILPGSRASNYSWPALIADQTGLTYECYARPGTGNLRILERIIEQSISNNSSDLFVIGWTWIDRFDYYNNNNDINYTIMPMQNTNLANFYYKNVHSQYRDKLTTLIHIRSAVDLLQQKQIPFIMTCMDNLIFETEWHTSQAIKDLQEYVTPYITNFDNKTFLEWSQENNFPISPTLHPLKEAHQAGAKLMLSKIKSHFNNSNKLLNQIKI